MTRSAIWWSATAVLAFGVLTPAMARPNYLAAFKAHYKTAQGKPTLNAANCSLCHIGMPNEAKWNPYGEAVKKALGATRVTDMAKIEAALVAAEKEKRTANARQTFGQAINADRLPAGMGMGMGNRNNANANANAAQRNTAPAGGTPTAPPSYGAWEAAFNGVNMDGLTKVNAGNWTVQNGLLKYTGGGNGWLKINKPYDNYSMVIVWRFPQAGAHDSGIFLKARPGDNGNPWPNSPQLNMGPGNEMGSIGGTQGSRARMDLIKANDWNTYQITVNNGVATLAINGQVAWEQAVGNNLTGMGNIGIEAEGYPLDIAQIWVMPLR